jgi:hypothetical protein
VPNVVDLELLRSAGKLAQELQIKKPHWNHKFASVGFDSKVGVGGSTKTCELWKRDTSAQDLAETKTSLK